MDFWQKIDKNPYTDLYWNVPDGQKRGTVAVIGGNGQNFRTPISVAEYLGNNYPLSEVRVVLPDALKSKLPPLDNLIFLKSTESGSFAEAEEIKKVIDSADFSLITGDLSKNTITKKALSGAVQSSANRGENGNNDDTERPLLITRDTVDLTTDSEMERILMRPELVIMGSLPQWQKIFRAVYYPKALMISQSLMQVVEAFHKFTLSYPVKAITLHEGQILIAENGKVATLALGKTGYSPLTIWNGECAAKVAALNLYNPGRFIEASIAGMMGN